MRGYGGAARRDLGEASRIEPGIDIARWSILPKAAEAAREVQSWSQGTVWEVHPELSFRLERR